jgi:hypothetical protein
MNFNNNTSKSLIMNNNMLDVILQSYPNIEASQSKVRNSLRTMMDLEIKISEECQGRCTLYNGYRRPLK